MAHPLPRRLPHLPHLPHPPLHLKTVKHFRSNALQLRNVPVDCAAASGAGVDQAVVTAESAARVESVGNSWEDEAVVG